MANPIITVLDDIGNWFKGLFKSLPKWTVIAGSALNVAAIAFEGVTAAFDPALAAVADPIITTILTKFGTVANLIKNGNAANAAQLLATIEADISQLETVANISDAATKEKIAAIVATLNAVLAAIPAVTGA
jgi:hypothetical protein